MSAKQQVLFEKCYYGELTEVKNLLEQGINPNTVQLFSRSDKSYSKEISALCIAAEEGHLEITQLLLIHGANVNYRCQQGESALFLAVRHGHLKVTQCLLEAGACVVYTAKAGEKLLLENWEVFTQALRKAYPKHINDPVNSVHKDVVQLLLEHNANSQRPSTLYEALYCSLTVFANPIAVYCVGAYAALSAEQHSVVFCEDNFIGALCHAFDMPHAAAFISTVQSILSAYKLRQKGVVQSLVKSFNWADFLRRFAENPTRGTTSDGFDVLKVLNQLMEILSIIVSNFHVRSEVQSQFAALASDDVERIGRLFKSLLDQQDENGNTAKESYSTWQVLIFLLKQQLRMRQNTNVARLLLRTGWNKGQDSAPSEFERRILLRCVDEDTSLAHLLIDFGVSVNGDCFVKFIQDGQVDLVDRCVMDNELLFCKEIFKLLQTPLAVRNSSNRNMRRCIRVIKNRRKSVEKDRSRFEDELLNNDAKPNKKGKAKKQQPRAKKQQPLNFSSLEIKTLSTLSINVADDETPDDMVSVHLQNVSSSDTEKTDNATKLLSNVMMQSGMEDSSSPNFKSSHDFHTKVKSKKKHKKKNCGKYKSDPVPIPEASSSERKNTSDGFSDSYNMPNNWRDVLITSSCRRRQSSSSSDASVGPKKSVHFSHPLTFYENTKPTEKSRHLSSFPDAVPKASSLKLPVAARVKYDLPESYSRTNKPLPEYANNLSRLNFIEPFDDCFDNGWNSCIPWRSVSRRWSPRFEDLSETNLDRLKKLYWSKDDNDEVTYFCDNQKHLNIGSGPDYSQIFLGLTQKGLEVSIKKINSKRAPLLGQIEVVTSLLALGEHCGVNKYHAIVREKSHFYVMQTVGDFSLSQVIRKKMILLPESLPESCHQIAEGLEHLHRNNILHMALKPSNIFLGSDGQLRLSDYGIHKRYQIDDHKRLLGPTINCMCWMAWESLLPADQAKFSAHSDVMCLGMVFFYILTNGNHPFGNPDAAPGECMSNINKGMYNLKALTDPLEHHLVKNMMFKEPEKRLKIAEVLSHPFFWSDEDKDSFIVLLAEAALTKDDPLRGHNLLQKLSDREEVIIKGTYAKTEHFIDVGKRVSSVKEILVFLLQSMEDSELFDRHTKLEIRSLAPSPTRYFLICFPTLLLHGYKVVSLDELKKASLKSTATTTKFSPENTCDSQTSLMSQLLHGKDCHRVASQSCCDLHQEHDSDEAKTNLVKENKESDGIRNVELFHAAEDKKNTGLCLSDLQTNSHNGVDLPNLENDYSCSSSSENESSNLLLESNWNHNSSMLNGDGTRSDSITSCKDLNQSQFKLDKSGLSFEHIKLSPNNSPDDWIEIGSPLVEESSDCIIDKSLPITASKISKSSFYGGCEGGSSSSCSVDACFDFDKFSRFSGNECATVPLRFEKEANHFAFACAKTFRALYTDIDELD